MPLDTVNVGLHAITWVQSLHTARGPSLRLKATVDHYRHDFIIENAGKMAGMAIELGLTRGPREWQTPGVPAEGIGFLGYHGPSESDDLGAFMSGGCSVSPEMYDDVWQRLKFGAHSQITVSLEVGPVSFEHFEDVVWKRSESKFLFIMAAEFTVVTRDKSTPEEGV